jgi:hypothetical protein
MIYFASTVIVASIRCTQCEHNATPSRDGSATGGLTPQTGTYTYISPSRNGMQWGEFVNIATAVAPWPLTPLRRARI